MTEIRAIVDEDFYWVNKKEADSMLERISKAGFNTLIAFVWSGRGTSWPSTLAPKGPKWEAEYIKGFDPLKYLIRKAHLKGIKVIAAFSVMKRQDDYDIFPQFYEPGTPAKRYSKAYELHMPEFRDFIGSLMDEVATNYDIDGINLDYIRSLGDCTSNTCTASYLDRYDRNLIDDHALKNTDKFVFDLISDWNRDAVKNIVSKLRKNNKDLTITTTSLLGGWEDQGADSIGWLNEGLIDHIFHMYYGYPKDFDYKYIFNQLDKVNEKRNVTVMVANYDGSAPRSGCDMDMLMDFSRYVPGYTNVGLYLYRYLTDEQINAIRVT